MPHITDTIGFLNGGGGLGLTDQLLSASVGAWLEEKHAARPISAQVETALSQVTKGSDTARKQRRAIILILCAFNRTPSKDALASVGMIKDGNLANALLTALRDVARIMAPKRFDPVINELRGSPTHFLGLNRIKIGRGAMLTSGASPYEMTWDPHTKIYNLQPVGVNPAPLSAQFNGFNIHVQSYTSVMNNLGAINGAVVTGDVVLTTQLSGCTVIYSVNGGNLCVAHIMPDAAVKQGVLPNNPAANAAQPLGTVLGLRMAQDGDLNNAVHGGTLGLYGMVDAVGDVTQRNLGARNVRMHGYCGALGNGYFIGVKKNGNWKLYGHQNNQGQPAQGVGRLLKLYP